MSRMVYGIHAVSELLRRGRSEVRALYIQGGAAAEGRALRPLLSEAARLGIAPIERTRGELDKLSGGGVHQGVLALCGPYPYASLSELLTSAGAAPHLLLILDGVKDPQNLGALLRSACLLGASGVVIPSDRAAQVTPAVVKASAGTAERVKVAQVVNLARAMEQIKQAGVWLHAASLEPGAGPPWQIDLSGPVGLVLGSEGAGLRPLTRKICDGAIRIPLASPVRGASLNVAAAGAVLLYEALRQRRARRLG